MAGPMLHPPIILLKEGTDTSQGTAQLISNIDACCAVAEVVKSTLGPRGRDKLIHSGQTVTISNDGATIMKLLEVVHPAAKTLVDISLSQDAQVGDGTTTVVILAGEFLKVAKPFIEEGVHPRNIIRSFREATSLAVSKLAEMAVSIEQTSEVKRREMLINCAKTSLQSKLVSSEKEFFAAMVVDAVQRLDPGLLDQRLIGIKKVIGGGLKDSFLVDGVAFKKTFSYAGFEQQPKAFANPKILLLNIELELKSEKENAEIRLDDPAKYQSIVDAEWNIIYAKLKACVDSGAKIVLSRLAIGDLATQYFADRDVFCAGRVPKEDLDRVAKATGAQIQTTVNSMDSKVLGECEKCNRAFGGVGMCLGFRFEEKQVGGERYNLFTGCPKGKTATIVLRGGSEQFIDEAMRSLHDAIMIVRRASKNAMIVAGGGANDMEISKHLRDHARSIPGKSQLFINAFAKAMEVIPRQLCDNAGFDATDILNRLRQKHAMLNFEGKSFGVDVNTGGIVDTFAAFVWEPMMVKKNAIQSASEAACLILSVDETVKNPLSEQPDATGMGRGRGRGMRGRGRGRGRF